LPAGAIAVVAALCFVSKVCFASRLAVLFYLLEIMYLPVSETAFSLLHCVTAVDAEGRSFSYLNDHPNVRCD
jgi:hypothetical protein